MAKMHSRARGKSGSRKPFVKSAPTWLTYKPVEVEKLITKLAKKDLNASQIGLVLRDSYGIPNVKLITGKRINDILKENGFKSELPEDLLALIRRLIKLNLHYDENKHDKSSRRGIMLTEAKIGRLTTYYIKTGVLPKGWKFEADKAKMYVA